MTLPVTLIRIRTGGRGGGIRTRDPLAPSHMYAVMRGAERTVERDYNGPQERTERLAQPFAGSAAGNSDHRVTIGRPAGRRGR